MGKHIAVIILIFLFTTFAWMILGASIVARSSSADSGLTRGVESNWGSAQQQSPPTAVATHIEPHTTAGERERRDHEEGSQRNRRHAAADRAEPHSRRTRSRTAAEGTALVRHVSRGVSRRLRSPKQHAVRSGHGEAGLPRAGRDLRRSHRARRRAADRAHD